MLSNSERQLELLVSLDTVVKLVLALGALAALCSACLLLLPPIMT